MSVTLAGPSQPKYFTPGGGDRPLHFDQKWVAADLQRLQISLHLASKFILCRFADIAEFSAFDWNISFMQICRVCRGYLRPISGSAPALVERQRRKTPDSKVWIISATRWRCLQLSKTRIFDKFWKKSDIGTLSSVLGQFSPTFRHIYLRLCSFSRRNLLVRLSVLRSQKHRIRGRVYLTQSKQATPKAVLYRSSAK